MASELDLEDLDEETLIRIFRNFSSNLYKERIKETDVESYKPRKEYTLVAPISGKIIKVLDLKKGDRVIGGEEVAIIECMKSLVSVRVPVEIGEAMVIGIGKNYQPGKSVRSGEELLRLQVI